MRIRPRLLFITATFVCLALTPTTAPQAKPVAGQGESVTYTYYSTLEKDAVVGGESYGSCGENFLWGKKTKYFDIRYVTCS